MGKKIGLAGCLKKDPTPPYPSSRDYRIKEPRASCLSCLMSTVVYEKMNSPREIAYFDFRVIISFQTTTVERHSTFGKYERTDLAELCAAH